jgi:hypothetical protein
MRAGWSFTRAAVVDEVWLNAERMQPAEQSAVYAQAKASAPQRWSGSTCNWELKASTNGFVESSTTYFFG